MDFFARIAFSSLSHQNSILGHQNRVFLRKHGFMHQTADRYVWFLAHKYTFWLHALVNALLWVLRHHVHRPYGHRHAHFIVGVILEFLSVQRSCPLPPIFQTNIFATDQGSKYPFSKIFVFMLARPTMLPWNNNISDPNSDRVICRISLSPCYLSYLSYLIE